MKGAVLKGLPACVIGALPILCLGADYEVTLQISIDANFYGHAWAINDLGHLSYGRTPRSGMFLENSYVYREGQTFVVAGEGDNRPYVEDLNNLGAAVGSCYNTEMNVRKPTIWNSYQSPEFIGSQGNCRAINDAGIVVGNTAFGFAWESGVFTELDHGAYVFSAPFDVSEDGLVVGTVFGPSGSTSRAATWTNGVLAVLDSPAGSIHARVDDISSDGTMVGSSYVASGDRRLLRWHGSVIDDLGSIPGDLISSSIASDGRILGSESHLYLNGSFQPILNLLPAGHGFDQLRAREMNASGQILARAIVGETDRIVVLSPVPEPSSIVALALALAWCIRRRCRLR